ncbi:MAG TPA: rRNA maturation RNase YbeY [Candidatus Hydrogenedentes bacterium]|nr:rRNA maturation RNase YbeY [Candidatus Hydrogenedentota bacterium]HNT88946.1 rRNA maturation RNase YbeY [Candidatus Hydrogenedentota bacterium]
MPPRLEIRNESRIKRTHRRDVLRRLAERVCEGEGRHGDLEISVLLCDDARIAELNRQYRKKRGPTDVLSFGQDGEQPDGSRVLGDVVISLETVARRCKGNPRAMREDVRLLFCHGLLHLLGYDHATRAEDQVMRARQARYLGRMPQAK